MYFKLLLNPLFLRASSYTVISLLSISSVDDNSDIGLLMPLGSSFNTVGGWFYCLFM